MITQFVVTVCARDQESHHAIQPTGGSLSVVQGKMFVVCTLTTGTSEEQ